LPNGEGWTSEFSSFETWTLYMFFFFVQSVIDVIPIDRHELIIAGFVNDVFESKIVDFREKMIDLVLF